MIDDTTLLLSIDEARLLQACDAGALGHRIHLERTARGLSQTELATPLVTAAYLSRIEAGQRKPSPKVLAHFAQRLAITTERLLVGTDAADDVQRHQVLVDHQCRQLAAATCEWLNNPRDIKAFERMTFWANGLEVLAQGAATGTDG
jgi:transcriptional regulator with XRE-family HTH domain